MTPDQIEHANALLAQVQFENYAIAAKVDGRGAAYMQATYPEADIYTGRVETQHTRRWLLSPAMTDSEIVQTAFKLCATSMEHRTRESFRYQGARVFGPHFDITDLVALCKDREDAGGRVQHGKATA